MGHFFLASHRRTPASVSALMRSGVCCLAAALLLTACAATPVATPAATAPANEPNQAQTRRTNGTAPAAQETIAAKPIPRTATTPAVAVCWLPLMQRLTADGLDALYLQALFSRMGDNYSHMPMGSKITELFTRKFLRQPPPPGDPSKKDPKADPKIEVRPRIYRNVVTEVNVERCNAYLAENAVAFSIVEKGYGVPKEIVVALLMVETKLGTYLGKDNAFWSLACMAAADAPEQVAEPLAALPMTPERMDWVKTKLRERSTWAYNELKSLIDHTRQYSLDPLVMPGSIYGAIGICQFMPSNLRPYAVDGNGDGRVDLFNPADAIPSVGSYLKGHGWQSGLSRAGQHAIIMRYNKSTIYANTILALADAINPPPDAGKAKAAKQAAPAKRPAGKDNKVAWTKFKARAKAAQSADKAAAPAKTAPAKGKAKAAPAAKTTPK